MQATERVIGTTDDGGILYLIDDKLTTFSTFSAEVFYMLQHGRLGWAATTIATHLFGSIVMTFIGYVAMMKFSGS